MKITIFCVFLYTVRAQCGQTEYQEDEGEITSPGYPGNYGNNLNCVYNIRVPAGLDVEVTIADLQIENDPQVHGQKIVSKLKRLLFDGKKCRFDSLRVQFLDTGQNNLMCNVLTDQRVIPFQSGTGSSLKNL